MFKNFFLLIILVMGFTVSAQVSGNIDPSFNTGDIGFHNGDGPSGTIYKTAIQTDGKILIGGVFSTYDGISRRYFARLNKDGTLDTTFITGSGTDGVVNAIAVQNDGKILIGGNFTEYNNIVTKRIARLNADGSFDATFNTGYGAGDVVYAICIQPDGKILIAGGFNSYNSTTKNRIMRLNSNGSIDATFQGTGANSTIYTMTIQGDGKILIAGSFTSYSGTAMNNLARLNTDGTLDPTFVIGTGTASISTSTIYSSALQTDGKIIIAGDFTSYNGTERNNVARLKSDGSIDASFSIGTGTGYPVRAVALQNDGKIILGGEFSSVNGIGKSRIARLNTDGSIDETFNVVRGAYGTVQTLAIQSDDKIIIGGAFTSYNGILRNYIARLHSNGDIDLTFNRGSGTDGTVKTMAILPDGKIMIAGKFTLYNGTIRSRIARLNTDGTPDTTFTTGIGHGDVFATAIQPDGKILIVGSLSSYNGKLVGCIARLNTNGTLDTTFIHGIGKGAGSYLYAIGLQKDGKIIIGGQHDIFNGTSQRKISRLNIDGSLDATFKPGSGANYRIETLTIQKDDKIIIGGSFSHYNGSAGRGIARMNADGTLDPTFNVGEGANHIVLTTALQNDGKIIIGGEFTTFNNIPRVRIARLNTNGSLDTTFNTGIVGPGQVLTSAIQPNGKIIIGGGFTMINGKIKNRVARLNTDGSIDSTFIIGTGANDIIHAVAIQKDERLIIGGDFTGYNGTGRNRVARLYNLIADILPATICSPGGCAILAVQVSGGTPPYTFLWNTGAVSASIKVCPSVATTYTVTVKDKDGLSTTAVTTVKQGTRPDVNVTQNNVVCPYECTMLTATGANTYNWLSNSVTPKMGAQVHACISNDPMVKVIGTSVDGCADTLHYFVNVFPQAQINITGKTTICPGESTTLTANGTPQLITYLWKPGGEVTPSITVSPITTTTYTVEATTNMGCKGMSAITVTVTTCSNVTEQTGDPYGFDLYPNPFTDHSTLIFYQEQKNVMLKMTDILGKEVRTLSFSGKQVMIEKEGLPAGIYFIQVVAGNELRMNKKVVIH